MMKKRAVTIEDVEDLLRIGRRIERAAWRKAAMKLLASKTGVPIQGWKDGYATALNNLLAAMKDKP